MSPIRNDVFYTEEADREQAAEESQRETELQTRYDNGYNQGYDDARAEYDGTSDGSYNDGYGDARDNVKNIAAGILRELEKLNIQRRNPDKGFDIMYNEMQMLASGEIE